MQRLTSQPSFLSTEIEISMLDEKLIKFLALQRIHQLFASKVQPLMGSVNATQPSPVGSQAEGKCEQNFGSFLCFGALGLCSVCHLAYSEGGIPAYSVDCALIHGSDPPVQIMAMRNQWNLGASVLLLDLWISVTTFWLFPLEVSFLLAW